MIKIPDCHKASKVFLILTILVIGFSNIYSHYLPWPMHMGNPQRTGLFIPTIGERGTMDSVTVKWRRSVTSISASPAIGDIDGDNAVEVVVGAENSVVYALYGTTGVIRWNRTLNASTYASGPAIGDIDGDSAMEVVIGTMSGAVYALAGNGLTVKWSSSVGSELATSPVIGNVDANTSTVEIVVHTKTTTTCLNGVGGTQKWARTTGMSGGDNTYSSPAIGDIDGNTSTIEVIVAANDTGTYALNGADGTIKWKCHTDLFGMVLTPPYLLYTPSIRDIDNDGIPEVLIYQNAAIYCINGTNGALKWASGFGSLPYSLGANTGVSTGDLNSDSKYEVVTRWKQIVTLDADSGNLLWTYVFPSSGTVHSNPVIADVEGDSKLEVVGANHGGYVACVEGENGALKWSIYVPSGGNVDIHPTCGFGDIDNDGCFEIVGIVNDGPVFALESPCPTAVEESEAQSGKANLTVLKKENKISVLFNLPESYKTSVSIFDICGREKANRNMGILSAGSYTANFDTKELRSNIYFVRVKYGDKCLTKKVVLVK